MDYGKWGENSHGLRFPVFPREEVMGQMDGQVERGKVIGFKVIQNPNVDVLSLGCIETTEHIFGS